MKKHSRNFKLLLIALSFLSVLSEKIFADHPLHTAFSAGDSDEFIRLLSSGEVSPNEENFTYSSPLLFFYAKPRVSGGYQLSKRRCCCS